MNGKIKTIGAALLAAAMCASFAGCADKTTPTGGNNTGGLNDSKIENPIESIFGGGSSSKKPVTSTPAEASEPEVKFEMTDEIKNAALNSGLIQINNDVFQQGGYITVADFVEKYKDRYDIVYQNADLPYEEAGEYLLRYDYTGEYLLLLTPKAGVGDSSKKIAVQIENRTISDEEDKIPIAEGVIRRVKLNLVKKDETSDPCWFPQGLSNSSYEGLETANEDYKEDSFIKMLEDNGFILYEGPSVFVRGKDHLYVKDSYAYITFWVAGEVNSFGKRPIYEYRVGIDAVTDKLRFVSAEFIGYEE